MEVVERNVDFRIYLTDTGICHIAVQLPCPYEDTDSRHSSQTMIVIFEWRYLCLTYVLKSPLATPP